MNKGTSRLLDYLNCATGELIGILGEKCEYEVYGDNVWKHDKNGTVEASSEEVIKLIRAFNKVDEEKEEIFNALRKIGIVSAEKIDNRWYIKNSRGCSIEVGNLGVNYRDLFRVDEKVEFQFREGEYLFTGDKVVKKFGDDVGARMLIEMMGSQGICFRYVEE